MSEPLRVTLQPKQGQFLDLVENSRASWLGYGGARGGAKSGAARRIMLRRRFQYPGTVGQIVRRVWDDVRENHVEKFFSEFPELEQFYNVQNHQLTLPTNPPSRILFGYAENERDVRRKAVGPEFMDIFVDQAEQFSEKELQMLKTTCRWPNTPAHRCKFGLFFNPGGTGGAFLHRVFGRREYHENEKPEDFAFLQAYGWDNVEWVREALAADGLTEKDFYSWSNERRFKYFLTRSQYGRDLDALPEQMRKGHLLGSFDSFAGQYFDNFDASQHTERPEAMGIQPWWTRWVSIDWGFEHPAVAYWHAISPEKRVVTYRELSCTHTAPYDLAGRVADLTGDEKIRAVFLSPDAFAKRTAEDTIAEQMGDVFAKRGIPRPSPADNDRKGGWMLMYQMLGSGHWVIGTNCENLIRVLPSLVRDERDVEDVAKVDGDDPADAARYGLKSHLEPGKMPADMRVLERLKQHQAKDLTNVAMQIEKFTREEKRKDKPAPVFRPRYARRKRSKWAMYR